MEVSGIILNHESQFAEPTGQTDDILVDQIKTAIASAKRAARTQMILEEDRFFEEQERVLNTLQEIPQLRQPRPPPEGTEALEDLGILR